MNIELPIVLTGLVLLLLFILPVIIVFRSNSKKENALSKEYNKIVSDNELKISNSDHWQDRIIGMDVESGKLIFLYRKDKEIDTFFISIKKIKQIKLIRSDNDDISIDLLMESGKTRKLFFYVSSCDYISEKHSINAIAEKWKGYLAKASVKPAETSRGQ